MASSTQNSKSVTAHNVIIDKLAITFDVPQSRVKSIASQLKAIRKEKFGDYSKNVNYQVGTKIWLNKHLIQEKATSSCLTVHTLPKFAGYRSCRVEWNPSKIPINVVASVALENYLGIDSSLIGRGIVTQLDVAVDVDNIQIDDILFHVPKYRLCKNIISSGMTRYIGGRSGKRYYCCYDKQAEIIAHNTRVYWDTHKEPVPDHPRMRIEARLSPKIYWSEIEHIENPFEIMKLRQFSTCTAAEGKSDQYVRMALALTRHDGLNAALSTLDKKTRALMKKRILDSQESCDWWRPEKLWRGFYGRYDEINSFVNAVDCKEAVG